MHYTIIDDVMSIPNENYMVDCFYQLKEQGGFRKKYAFLLMAHC